jgi:hypothetical protein
MSTHGAAGTTAADDVGRRLRIRAGRTETKSAFQTTEMVAYVIVMIAVLIAARSPTASARPRSGST